MYLNHWDINRRNNWFSRWEFERKTVIICLSVGLAESQWSKIWNFV